MFDFMLAAHNWPFAVALALMLLIGLVEAVGLGLGGLHLDAGIDVHDPGLLDGLGIGRVPLLILLVIFLAAFGMVGVAVQGWARAMLGAPLSPGLASLAAAGAALPLSAGLARLFARILPGDETTAVDIGTLVGRRGEVLVGTATAGSPAQVRVRDVHGQPHHVMVEPHVAGIAIPAGARVLLVRREGNVFFGLAEDNSPDF